MYIYYSLNSSTFIDLIYIEIKMYIIYIFYLADIDLQGETFLQSQPVHS